MKAWRLVRGAVQGFLDDDGTDLAAVLTFYAVLSLFPGTLALLALVAVFGQQQRSVDFILQVLSPLLSRDSVDTVRGLLTDLASSKGAGITLVVALLGAVWSASGYVGAFGRAMNRVNELEETRPWWRLRPVQLLITVVTLLLSALALVILVVSGPVAQALGDALGLGDGLLLVWNIAKWPVLAIAVMLVVGLLYWATPDLTRSERSFRVISLGAFVAIVVWLVASAGFAVYVANFASYDRTYGSVAGAVVALLWLWITNVALVFGGELDAEVEKQRTAS